MKPIRKLDPALLEKFGQPAKPRVPESVPEEPVEKIGIEKIGGEPPKVTEPKLGEPSSPTPPQAQTKRSAAPKIIGKTGVKTVTAPKRTAPSGAIKPVKWEDKLKTLSTTAAADLPNDFKYVRPGVQDVTDPTKLKSFIKALDPFALLKAPPARTASANAKYKALDAKQWQSYFAAVSITGPLSSGGHGARPAPDESALDRAVAVSGATASGVPKLQHSVWVGGPLRADVTKQKAFMDRLVKNATDNPGWDVCLWTDQSRTEMLAAPADSPLGKYRDWAAANNIKLIPVDEVFAGDNAMQLQGMYQLEQVKGGTGRAAASDLLRLEIIHRFGGVYCDGDKPINTPLNDIAKYTSEHGGYTTAQERGSFQNCGMCGIPGNALVTSVIETIRANYGKPRDNLLPKQRQNRPTRFEVIMRTGPSVVRDVALAGEGLAQADQAKSKHLMPQEFITPPSVYTTSWDPSIVPCYGDRDLGAVVQNKVTVESAANARARVASAVSALRKKMQARPAVSLTADEEAAQVAAVQKAVTALVYGVWNNDGHFNMDLAEQHIKTAPNRDLAREMVVKVFADRKMADVAKQVKTVQLPGNAPTKDSAPSAIPLPESTLDALFRGALFPNLKVENFTLQHAAYMGNTQFIDYARQYNFLDLSTVSSRTLETGQRMQGDRTYATDNLDVLAAALRGGQRDVLAQLSNRAEFGALAESAASAGQLDTLLWAVHALPVSSRGSDNLAGLMQKLLSLKRPSQGDDGSVSMIALSDDEALYLFNQFAQGLQTEIGAGPDMTSQPFTALYEQMIETGRPKLAARMETLGARLSNLSRTDRDAVRTKLTGAGADLPALVKPYLQLAQKAGFVTEMITAASARQLPNLDTVKNDYATVHTDPENSIQLLQYLAKGLAYAQSHIDDKNAGRGTRVDGWRNGVRDVITLLNTIPSTNRKPEQAALLDAANQVSAKLQTMKRSAFV